MKNKSIFKIILTLFLSFCMVNSTFTLSLDVNNGMLLVRNTTEAYSSQLDSNNNRVYVFNYTGNPEEILLPPGRYCMEAWGARGGNYGMNTYSGYMSVSGGNGAYVKGEIMLMKDTKFYAFVGGAGQDNGMTGGYNGGGNAGGNGGFGAGGGGATDIRYGGTSLYDRILVAGGGGGSGANSAYGGGTINGEGYTGDWPTWFGGRQCTSGTPATQVKGGTGGYYGSYNSYIGSNGLNGSMGIGGSGGESGGSEAYIANGGGGGGGYYGGGGGGGSWCHGTGNFGCGSSGSGGSSFISGYPDCNAVNISGQHTGQPKHYSGLEFSNSAMTSATNNGNGKIKITYITADPSLTSVAVFKKENKQIYFSGKVNDRDLGDALTIKYIIDDGEESELKNTFISDGIDKEFISDDINVGELSKGEHTISIWALDNKGGISTVSKLSFTIDDPVKLAIKDDDSSQTKAHLLIYDQSEDFYQYQITCNSLYVTETGSLTSSPTWIARDSSTTCSSIIVKELLPENKYVFGIRARKATGEDSYTYSSITYETTLKYLPSPENVNLRPYSNQVVLSWTPVEGAKFYSVEADGIVSTTSALYFAHTGLISNTTHSYRLRTEKLQASGEWSNLLRVKTLPVLPAAPSELTVKATGTTIKVSWQPLEGVVAYEVEFDGQTESVKEPEYFKKGLNKRSQHSLRVRAKNLAGYGNWSNIYTQMTSSGELQSAPENIEYRQTDTTITIKWDDVLDAEYYEVAEISREVIGQIIDNGPATSCEIKGLSPGTSYTYLIRARNRGDEGMAPWGRITVTTYPLGTPGNILAHESDRSIIFTWDKVSNAESYVVIINKIIDSEHIQFVNKISGIVSNTYTCEQLEPETDYIYNVKAVNSVGESAWSEERTAATLPVKPQIPQMVKAIVSDVTINISWQSVPDAEGYDVDLNGVLLENDNSTTYKYTQLIPDTPYKYRIRARNSGVEGEWSEFQEIRTMPGKPQIPKDITVKSSQTGANITWQTEPGADSYDLEISQLQDDGSTKIIKLINSISNTSYTHRKLNKGEEYRYRIRTKNVQGISPWSGDIINNAIKAQCKKGSTLDLGLTATDVVDFTSYEMVVTYNPGVVEVADLSTLTGAAELTAGKIEGTGITIKEFSQGRIVFVVDKAVTPGEAWTGVINGIKFKARETGGTTITYTVFTRQE